MTLKSNKRPLLHYAKINSYGISVPPHRIVRSEGFKKNLEACERIVEKLGIRKKIYQKEKLIQQFKGYIIDITPEIFKVEFTDITEPSNPIEIHTFNMNILSRLKQRELKCGEDVYWDFYRTYNGEIKNQLTFIPLRKITNREIKEAERYAEELASFFNNNLGE